MLVDWASAFLLDWQREGILMKTLAVNRKATVAVFPKMSATWKRWFSCMLRPWLLLILMAGEASSQSFMIHPGAGFSTQGVEVPILIDYYRAGKAELRQAITCVPKRHPCPPQRGYAFGYTLIRPHTFRDSRYAHAFDLNFCAIGSAFRTQYGLGKTYVNKRQRIHLSAKVQMGLVTFMVRPAYDVAANHSFLDLGVVVSHPFY